MGRVDGKERWQSWRWLIGTYQTARGQSALHSDCVDLIKRAEVVRFNVGEEHDKVQFHKELIDNFSRALALDSDGVNGIAEIKHELEDRESLWSELADRAREERPPVFVSHAFLRLSDSTGLEIASLFIAGLVALGVSVRSSR